MFLMDLLRGGLRGSGVASVGGAAGSEGVAGADGASDAGGACVIGRSEERRVGKECW